MGTDRRHQQTMFTQTNADEATNTENPDGHPDEEMHTSSPDDPPKNPTPADIDGPNKSPSGGSESECPSIDGEAMFVSDPSKDSETTSRSANEENSPPYPAKAETAK